MLQARRPSSMD